MLFTYHKYRKSVDEDAGDIGKPVYTGLHQDVGASFELRERVSLSGAESLLNDDRGRGTDKGAQVRELHASSS